MKGLEKNLFVGRYTFNLIFFLRGGLYTFKQFEVIYKYMKFVF